MSSTSATAVKPLHKKTVDSAMREAKKSKKLLVLEFTEKDSDSCQKMKPVMEAVVGEVEKQADIYDVDVDEHKDTAQRLGVDRKNLPMILVVKSTIVVDRFVGEVKEHDLLQSIQAHKMA